MCGCSFRGGHFYCFCIMIFGSFIRQIMWSSFTAQSPTCSCYIIVSSYIFDVLKWNLFCYYAVFNLTLPLFLKNKHLLVHKLYWFVFIIDWSHTLFSLRQYSVKQRGAVFPAKWFTISSRKYSWQSRCKKDYNRCIPSELRWTLQFQLCTFYR